MSARAVRASLSAMGAGVGARSGVAGGAVLGVSPASDEGLEPEDLDADEEDLDDDELDDDDDEDDDDLDEFEDDELDDEDEDDDEADEIDFTDDRYERIPGEDDGDG